MPASETSNVVVANAPARMGRFLHSVGESPLRVLLIGLGLLLSLASITFVVLSGSVREAYAIMAGYSAIPLQPVIDLGVVEVGSDNVCTFIIRNLTSKVVTVIGSRAEANCNANSLLPLVIPPGEARELPVFVQLSAVEDPFERVVELFLDIPSTRPLLVVRGRATSVNPPEPPSLP